MAVKLDQNNEVYTKEFLPRPKMRSRRKPRRNPEQKRTIILVVFFIASVLFHFFLAVLIVLLAIFFPSNGLLKKIEHPTTITLLQEDPTQPKAPAPPVPKPEHPFMPTEAQENTTPNPNAAFESDHNTKLQSESKVARKQDAVMPDVQGKKDRPLQLDNSRFSPTQKQQNDTALTPPQTQEQPLPKTAPQFVPKPAAIKPTDQQQQLTPDGLPVLPPLDAPTLEKPDAIGKWQTKPRVQKQSAPPSSFSADKSDIEGSASTLDKTSPEAMESEFGKYKAKVFRGVGSRWYSKMESGQVMQAIPVGSVHIHFTIHSDGTVDWQVLSGTEPNMQLLRSISENAIREAAPYDPFTESLKKQIGDSYSDDFTFSVY